MTRGRGKYAYLTRHHERSNVKHPGSTGRSQLAKQEPSQAKSSTVSLSKRTRAVRTAAVLTRPVSDSYFVPVWPPSKPVAKVSQHQNISPTRIRTTIPKERGRGVRKAALHFVMSSAHPLSPPLHLPPPAILPGAPPSNFIPPPPQDRSALGVSWHLRHSYTHARTHGPVPFCTPSPLGQVTGCSPPRPLVGTRFTTVATFIVFRARLVDAATPSPRSR